MASKYLACLLVCLSGSAWAQIDDLYNADVTEYQDISNPAEAVKAAEGQWLAFSMPVLEGTRSPCCWKGKWGVMGEVGCGLAPGHTSYGSRSDSPLVDEAIVYASIRDGRVHKLRVMGTHCPVDGNGEQVAWIGEVDENAGMDWLEGIARADDSDGALYALALHRSDGAAKRLYSLARDTDKERGSEAVFWLGEARGEQGFNFLERLLGELPRGDRRREINFALSQNDSPEAAQLLLEISKSDRDPEQRGEALFWLAQEYPNEAKGWLKEVIAAEQDEDILEKAVFAVSQLPGEDSSRMLLDIARDKQAPREARRQALFWLAQSDDDEAVAALADLLTR
ncbi:MAG: HEAT repeat domain-containing protein [Xanthomonadales bacterium]|nr:HEAT repeat domain-containing protein [Xanthomonadales bacterium]